MRQWRLIYDRPTPGPRNMAVDEVLLGAVAAGQSPPVLRLYGWEPLCLSLGYGQQAGDVDFERLQARGWDVVRRPTGGRAILHGDELTYSVCLPEGHPLAQGDVVSSYRRLSSGLAAGLERLGLSTQADRQTARAGKPGPVCFEVPSHYEITAGGRKLIGSAQTRRRGGILQHGSLPLWGDVARICDALFYPDEEAREQARQAVRARATTLEEALGYAVSWQEAAEALVEGFAQVFALDFYVDELSAAEAAAADELAGAVYEAAEWTNKR